MYIYDMIYIISNYNKSKIEIINQKSSYKLEAEIIKSPQNIILLLLLLLLLLL